MATMGGDRRQMMEDAAEDKFPEGLRILVVDDDRVCLTVLEALLRRCKYQPTTVMDAKTALRMLMAGKQQFDLVITDVRMPDMDGFKLLELIRLEMDLPVIMLSVDCDKKVVMKGIEHGASDFMVKPVRTHELKNIWQHVQRWRNPKAISHISDHDSDVQRVQPATAEKSKLPGNKRNVGDDSNKHNESTCVSTTHGKPRVTWTLQLHNKFLEAINQIGLDRAVPKKVLELMNVDYLSRENIASHLQKYRLHLKKVNSNHSGDAYERWNSSYNMNNKDNFMHNHEHGRWSASSSDTSSWSTNNYGAIGHLAPAMNTQSNFDMGSYLHDGRVPRYVGKQPSDARRFTGFGDPPVSLYNNIPNEIKLDEFPSFNYSNSYADLMCGKLMETSKGKTPSNRQSSFANTTVGGGRSLVASQVNFPQINQLESYAMSSSRLPLQNEKAPFISNTTLVGGFTEQMAPFNMASNTSSVGTMLNGSSALDASRTSTKDNHLVNSERTTSMLHNLQTNDFFSLTQLLDGGDGASILPMQEGTLDQQPLNDQLNEINAFSVDDIFSHMNLEDFTGDDPIVEEA
ncbi:two-component response regulator ORR24-like [Triticum dicoccoides]|uniref:two-component response regulator ORR24-like n=1 Tax=Triticum dicoccoides TaxID=85692 RepID=UPI00188DF767|nr:two-component response regulator ORR24-like [Triticum dicoccoides]